MIFSSLSLLSSEIAKKKKKTKQKNNSKKSHKTFSKLEMISGCSILMVF
jgi:hypothetical protein